MTINVHHSKIKVIFAFLALSSSSTMANKIFGGCLTRGLLMIALSLDGSTSDENPNKLNDSADLYWPPSIGKALSRLWTCRTSPSVGALPRENLTRWTQLCGRTCLESRGPLFRELERRGRVGVTDSRLHSKRNLGVKASARPLLGVLVGRRRPESDPSSAHDQECDLGREAFVSYL